MSVNVNLRHLETKDVHLQGETSSKALDLQTRDQVVQVSQPLKYDLLAQKLEDGILVQGRLDLTLDCQCVRCLKAFPLPLRLDDWSVHLPLEGEDAVTVNNDSVDLTPYLREDILLEFPQHPLCDPECGGLPDAKSGNANDATSAGKPNEGSSAWAELNKLKL